MIKTIASTELPIGEQLMIRKNVIGYGGGKRLCIVTGTHGDELEGQMVCYEMARRLGQDLRSLDGTVEIYPALNPLGIDTMMRGIPNFDLDMNRIFPGNPGGTMIEQAAYAIVEDLKGADLVIDVHSSNIYLRETPQVRINVNDEQRLVPIAQQMGIEFVWIHDAATVLESTLAHSLNATGTPCLVVEMGVGLRINHKMCSRLVDGMFTLMAGMGMWHGDTGENAHRVQGRQGGLSQRRGLRRVPDRPQMRRGGHARRLGRRDCGATHGHGAQQGGLSLPRVPVYHPRLPHRVRGLAYGAHIYPVNRCYQEDNETRDTL